jgi:tRNA pseudouridine38-40 synthase
MVAYDGAGYFGFVRQPGRPTVEEELLKAFRQCGLCRKLKEAGYRVAARTDRGVSAVGQVVALNVLKKPRLQQLNAVLPEDIAVLAAAEVRQDFDPRTQARSKHYRYVCEVPPAFDLQTARQAAKLFKGVHDFRHFCKHERGRTTAGKLEYASVRKRENILVFDFLAPAFLWQQVRRMVWSVLTVGTGRLSLDEFKEMVEGHAKQAARPAPAEGLFLVGIRYPLLALRPDARAVSGFIEHLKSNPHPVYGEMVRLISSAKTGA